MPDWSKLANGGSYIENLRARLQQYGISQNAVAREMQVTPSEFSRWMVGRITPRLDTVVRIEKAVAAIRERREQQEKRKGKRK